MGLTFDPFLRIAGHRPALFKDALRSFMRTRSPGAFIDPKSLFPQRRDGAIVLEECIDRRLIRAEDWAVTGDGEAIARGKAARRTPLAKAQMVLDDFLDRVERLNRDPDTVRFVDQVRLFGSVMREEPTVGDIDAALITSRRPEFSDDHAARKRHLERLLAGRQDLPESRHRALFWSAEDWITNRALFGPRRHPLLAGVQEGESDLAALAVPCRLIYDRAKGGRVEEPVLLRHPASTGRSADSTPPAVMPGLAPAPIRPMDARWVAGFDNRGPVSPYDVFRGWTDEAQRLFPHYPRRLRVVGDGHDLRDCPWTPQRLKSGGLDGRDAVALIDATCSGRTGAILRRSIRCAATWTLRASFEHVEVHQDRKRVDLATLPDLAAAVSLILAVDAERMLRRVAEHRTVPDVTINFGGGVPRGDIVERLLGTIRQNLAERVVRIEPSGWSGAAVRITAAESD